jgi:DNA polymerase
MIKRAIKAPPGYTLIDCDSSQIEARTLAWLACQDDLVTAFANGEDVYKIMAGKIYNKPVSEITSEERFFGKTVILGCGYGMGAKKFHLMLKLQGMDITEDEALRIIQVYRNTYPRIKQLWYNANDALSVMLSEGREFIEFGRRGVVQVIPRGFELPNKLRLTYNNLRCDTEGLPEGGSKITYSYDSRKEKGIYIYGGKVVENVVQALARCVVGEQMVKISKRYRVVLTVHDAIMCAVENDRIDEARSYVEECMRWVPDWASGLPVNCESGVGENYADC